MHEASGDYKSTKDTTGLDCKRQRLAGDTFFPARNDGRFDELEEKENESPKHMRRPGHKPPVTIPAGQT